MYCVLLRAVINCSIQTALSRLGLLCHGQKLLDGRAIPWLVGCRRQRSTALSSEIRVVAGKTSHHSSHVPQQTCSSADMLLSRRGPDSMTYPSLSPSRATAGGPPCAATTHSRFQTYG